MSTWQVQIILVLREYMYISHLPISAKVQSGQGLNARIVSDFRLTEALGTTSKLYLCNYV